MASTSRDSLNTPVLHPVWRKLSMELVEIVLKYVPFESLVRFRTICKWLKCLITTPKFARECKRRQVQKSVPVIMRSSIPLDSCSMEIFNSETNSWLTHRLPIFEAPLEGHRLPIFEAPLEGHRLPILEAPLYPLKLSAASGGLVCFVTKRHGTFVVCNPLTGAFRLLEIFPFPVVDPVFNDICALVRCQAAFTVLVVDIQVGTFMLVIVTTSRIEIQRKTFLYDSVNRSWRSGAPLPHMYKFINEDSIKTLTFNGSAYVLLKTGTVNGFRYRLLKYNVCRDNWTEISKSDLFNFHDNVDTGVDILEHQGQVIVVSFTRQWLQDKYSQTCLPQGDFQINPPIAHCRVIRTLVDHGETLVEDKVMFQVLLRDFDTYQGWMNVATFNSKHTTIVMGDINWIADTTCIARDPYHRMQVLHFNCNSKKLSLLSVFRFPKSYNRPQDIFELSLCEPSLTIDL